MWKNFRLPLPQPPEWFQVWNFSHWWVIWHTHHQPKLCLTLTLATMAPFPHSSYSLGRPHWLQEFCHTVRDYCGKGLESQSTTGIFLALPGWEQHVVCCCKAWTSHPGVHQARDRFQQIQHSERAKILCSFHGQQQGNITRWEEVILSRSARFKYIQIH